MFEDTEFQKTKSVAEHPRTRIDRKRGAFAKEIYSCRGVIMLGTSMIQGKTKMPVRFTSPMPCTKIEHFTSELWITGTRVEIDYKYADCL